jgi:type IV secretion system protein VirB8
VRFIATVSDGEDSERHHRIATIAYDYEPDASIPLSALADNALGFAVSEYRSEPEDAS